MVTLEVTLAVAKPVAEVSDARPNATGLVYVKFMLFITDEIVKVPLYPAAVMLAMVTGSPLVKISAVEVVIVTVPGPGVMTAASVAPLPVMLAIDTAGVEV